MREGCDPRECKLKCTERMSVEQRQEIYKDFRGPDATHQTQVIINYKNHKPHNG